MTCIVQRPVTGQVEVAESVVVEEYCIGGGRQVDHLLPETNAIGSDSTDVADGDLTDGELDVEERVPEGN